MKMMIPNELKIIISIFDNGMIWIYIGLFFIFMYLLISLLTWSFIKPLKYLGIPTVAVGVLFLIIRFSSSFLVNIIKENMNIILVLLPSVLKPVLYIGIGCTSVGIIMIVIYNIIKTIRKKKHI